MTNKARAAMVRHLSVAIRHRGLTDTQAAEWLQVPKAKIEALKNGDAEAFTLAELEAMTHAEAPPPAIPAERHWVLYERLEPGTDWRGGRITDTDLLPLEEAARMASKHAGQEVTPADFLRAAGRGEISLHAVVRRTAKVRTHDGGVFCNRGGPNENIVPAGCIPILPLTACQHLANASRASWRTFDGRGEIDGFPVRYTLGMLTDDEPDFETVSADCRVTGYNVRALAGAFCDAEPTLAQTQAAAPAKSPTAPPDWMQQAQFLAREIIERQRQRDLYPSQQSIADEIANALRATGTVGAGGKPLTGAYIKRHALRGISSARDKSKSTAIRRGK